MSRACAPVSWPKAPPLAKIISTGPLLKLRLPLIMIFFSTLSSWVSTLLIRCDSVDVGDQWVATGRVRLEVSWSLSLRGSPAEGHLLPAFPSLFMSPWQFIPLSVKAPPLPSPHFLLSSAEFGTTPQFFPPVPTTQAKACCVDPFTPPPSRLCDIRL